MFPTTILFLGLWIIFKENKSLSPFLCGAFFLSMISMILLLWVQSTIMPMFLIESALKCFGLAIFGFVLNATSSNKILQVLLLAISVYASSFLNITTNDIESTKINKFDDNGEIMVEVKPEHVPMLKKFAQKYKITTRPAFYPTSALITDLDEYYILDVPNEKQIQVETILKELQSYKEFIWVEPNEIIPFEFPQKSDVPPTQSKVVTNDPSVSLQWQLAFLNMNKYYSLFEGNRLKPKKKAKLFILDTGLDGKHEDIESMSKVSLDKQGHGTHCAGIAAAITNNNLGIASMSPGKEWVEIQSIQVIGNVGFGTQFQIISGIIQAADNGADVISLSLGGITNQEREKAYNDAVAYANKKGAIVVVAAGNANLDAKRYSPANAQNVIAVCSVSDQKIKSGFSNYVANISMALAAPGEKILSTTPSNSYTSFSGTSMATPQVAGLIAVMKALSPDLSTSDVFSILNETGAITVDPNRTGQLIQPYEAILKLIVSEPKL
ncbi:MAG: S8 family serine peptidase [Saprospiraceae bacterium]|nr:S8 family serine peptidase [Saprospiraceae bacterium]